MHAVVLAPPRLFVLDTPSATAVDLGCEYDLTVDAQGASRLQVLSCLVELEGQGQHVTVRAGMWSLTEPGKAPRVPLDSRATPAFVSAVERLGVDASVLPMLLRQAEKGDAPTLWRGSSNSPPRPSTWTLHSAWTAMRSTGGGPRCWQLEVDERPGSTAAGRARVMAMFGEMLDTSPAQRDAYSARSRALTVQERAAMLTRLCRGVRSLAEAGIRHQHPGISAPEVRRELAVRLSGEDVAMRLPGPKKSSAP